jgi:hypothetical protein
MRLLVVVACLCLAAGASAQEWDFVPGERLLLYDDFTDMRPGAALPHWKVRGASVTLERPGRLRVNDDTRLAPNIAQWPQNFTLEQEFVIDPKVDQGDMRWEFGPEPGEPEVWLQLVYFPDGNNVAVMLKAGGEVVGEAEGKWRPGEPIRNQRRPSHHRGAGTIEAGCLERNPAGTGREPALRIRQAVRLKANRGRPVV